MRTPRRGAKGRALGTREGIDVDRIARQLGASDSFEVVSSPHGIIGAWALQREIEVKLQSRGGRPSDPAAKIRRLVPLKREVWRELQARAQKMSTSKRRVSPGQLAAILLEKGLRDLGTQ